MKHPERIQAEIRPTSHFWHFWPGLWLIVGLLALVVGSWWAFGCGGG